LRHLRDAHSIQTLGRAIVKDVCSYNPIWTKWTAEREAIARAAAFCWIPPEEFREYLNRMPGPQLTRTDVVERLRAFNEESYAPYPDEDQRPACLEISRCERSEGTDMPAIVGAIQAFVEEDRGRRHKAKQEAYRRSMEEQRLASEERLRSGADCKWTVLGSSKTVYCRVNARLYRLDQQPDRRWELQRISVLDDLKGEFIGCYGGRGDATKAVREMAYKPEPRWR
jgi:hypothetical protein